MTDSLIQFVRSFGELNVSSAAALALVFVTTGLVLVPRALLCLAAGAMFGLPAIPVILPSTTAGGVIAFLLARHLMSGRLRRQLETRPRLRVIADAVDSEGWRVVALLRVGSPLPSAVLSYLFGLTRIGLAPFTLATFFFTVPQITLYVYLGAAGRAAFFEDGPSVLSGVLLAAGAVTLGTAVMLIGCKSRRALRSLHTVD